MDIQIIVIVLGIAFLFTPTKNQKTSLIKIIGLTFYLIMILLITDWVNVIELFNSYINNFSEWLLIKSDNDQQKAKTYFAIFIIVAMQPIIFGLFFFYKKNRMKL